MSLRWLARKTLTLPRLPEAVLRHRAKQFVTVLGYHRILPPVGRDYPFNESVISATPEEFARELRFLRANLDVISVSDLQAGLEGTARLPRRPAVITFDDGYADNHGFALPLLRDAGLPACFFVCTGLLGTRNVPWHEAWVCCLKRSAASEIESPFGGGDPPYLLDDAHRASSIQRFRRQIWRLPYSQVPARVERLKELTRVDPAAHAAEPLFMTWDQARDMAAAGMDIGGHTRSHPSLARVDDRQTLADEVAGCFRDIEREIGRPPVAFAYPFGYAEFMSAEADAAIEQAGFGISFSFINGFAPRRPSGVRRLPRIHASLGNDFAAFRVRMATAPSLS